jgi:hypothetical protein
LATYRIYKCITYYGLVRCDAMQFEGKYQCFGEPVATMFRASVIKVADFSDVVVRIPQR